MKTLLISIDYTDSTHKFYSDSCIKNKKVKFDPEKQTVHELIKDICEAEDYMELSYKGKPQRNIFRDDKEGNSFICGYLYRGKTVIHDRSMSKPQTALFDVWVTIDEVIKFEFEDLDS
jgi:hypothetical protein